MLILLDTSDPTETLRCIGPFKSHEEAGAAGEAEARAGEFWTTEVEQPE
jgi:hypothetical protein